MGNIEAEIFVQSTFSLAQTPTDRNLEEDIYSPCFTTSPKKKGDANNSASKQKINHSDQIPTQSSAGGSLIGNSPKRPPVSPKGSLTKKLPDSSKRDSKSDIESKQEQRGDEWVIQNSLSPAQSRIERPSTTRQNSFISSPTQSVKKDLVAGQSPKITDRTERLFSAEMQAQLGDDKNFKRSIFKSNIEISPGTPDRQSFKEESFFCPSPPLTGKTISAPSYTEKGSEKTVLIKMKGHQAIGSPKLNKGTAMTKGGSKQNQPRLSLHSGSKPGPAVLSQATSK